MGVDERRRDYELVEDLLVWAGVRGNRRQLAADLLAFRKRRGWEAHGFDSLADYLTSAHRVTDPGLRQTALDTFDAVCASAERLHLPPSRSEEDFERLAEFLVWVAARRNAAALASRLRELANRTAWKSYGFTTFGDYLASVHQLDARQRRRAVAALNSLLFQARRQAGERGDDEMVF